MRKSTGEESQVEGALPTTSSRNIEESLAREERIVSPAQHSPDGKSIEIPVGQRKLVIGCWPLGVIGLFILALVFSRQEILVPLLAGPAGASDFWGIVSERLGDFVNCATAWIPR